MTGQIVEKEIPLVSGGKIREMTLSNGYLTLVVHDFGARCHKIFTPDRNGVFENILLSRDEPDSYAVDGGYYGLICGPVAGRIAGAAYDDLRFEANENGNLLHSGEKSWERQFWTMCPFQTENSVGVTLTLEDEISGFLGPIKATVTYELIKNQLKVFLTALSKKDTVFNPAFHPYFNLSADHENTLNHLLTVPADRLVEVDSENIPTGFLTELSKSSYDLRRARSISDIQKQLPDGLDNCFVYPENLTEKTLTLYSPNSGRKLSCQTDRQAVVIYTATHPEQNSTIAGKRMTPNRGIAIEFQELPDMVHHPEWGSIALPANTEKTFCSSYTFSTE
ncbi:aldose epimerase family protein [Lactococcus nasutitermitis]